MTAGSTAGPRSWLRVTGPADPRLTVVCLPHAGAGATSFARWQTSFDSDVRLVRVRLPGREDAPHEAPLRRVHDAVHGLLPAVSALGRDGPVALYGHSVGALVAYELARAMATAGTPPVRVVVSGRRAPHLPPRRPPLHLLADDEFLAGVDAMSTSPVRRTAAGVPYLLRVLRADLELGEEYAHVAEPLLEVPLAAFGGADDPVVGPDEIAAWADVVADGPDGADVRIRPGGHFFHHDARAEIAAMLQTDG